MNSPPQQPPPRHHITTQVLPPLAGAAATFSLLTVLLLIYRRLKHSLSSTSPSHNNHHRHLRRYSYSSLRRATSSFNSSRRLGRGGFGSVFSATLNNRHVAVKVMDSRSLQGEREFHNEIRLAQHLVDSDRVVKLLGYAAAPRSRKLCLVYEIMTNGNLQDCLLHKKSEEMMTWRARYCVAVDIAKGLAFLHHECDPVIIHGDIKPSNVLLDGNFVAKIADFGLARVKLSDNYDNIVVNCDNNDVVIDVNDSGSVLETESVGTTTLGFEEVETEISPENLGKESDLEAGIEGGKVEGSVEGSVRGLGKDWWRKCEMGGGWGEGEMVKEYVMEWMGMEVAKEKTGNDGNVGVGTCSSSLEVKKAEKKKDKKKKMEWWRKRENVGGEGETVKEYVMEWMGMDVAKERTGNELKVVGGGAGSSSLGVKKTEKKKGKKKMEWWMSMDDVRTSKKEKRRPVREWWKEEYSEELAKKKKKKKKREGGMDDHEENWWPRDEETGLDKNSKKSRSRMSRMSSRSSVDWWLDGLSGGDLWKVRHASFDSMSGEIIPKSGGISSTPSIRGTVCYIAPEYSMGGDLSEKCDVYSFGVVMLVLIAGRRPLQVTGSPMSEFHKANLLSWARQLARSGKLLDLVDDKICFLNREQAELCIVIALSCLQKVPARRPSMKDVVGILTGELPPPVLPVEYSPSKYPHRSRKKVR